MSKKISGLFTTICILTLCPALPMHAIVILPAQESAAAKFGRSLGEGFSKGMEQAQSIARERQHRAELEKENRVAAEIDYYNRVVSQLSCEPSHQTLTLPQEISHPFIHRNRLKMWDGEIINYEFKRKFNRVLAMDNLIEWLWSLDILNETPKKFLSSGNMDYPKLRLEIELLDSNNFVLSSCVIYTNLSLKRGESKELQGKWILPYDQVSRVSNYRICLGGTI